MQTVGNSSLFAFSKYVRTGDTRMEIYAGRVACCPLVSHVEYVPRALLRLEKRWGKYVDYWAHAI